MDIDLLRTAGTIVTLAAALGAVVAGSRWARARWRRVSDFLDDWNGEPARPGVAARPGAIERLSAVEASVHMIRSEVTPNHGGSMKDVIGRIDKQTRSNGRLTGGHLRWHANRGEIDPTARVLLARPDDQD